MGPTSQALSAAEATDEAGYLLLEEARLRCEEVRHQRPVPKLGLEAIHRELGLAGFHAGAGLAPWTRHGLLVLARDRSERVMPEPQERMLALFVTTMAAERSVEARLTSSACADHTHLAHVHLLGAQRLLKLILMSDPAVLAGV